MIEVFKRKTCPTYPVIMGPFLTGFWLVKKMRNRNIKKDENL
jgi:hypothetical protein